MKTIPYGRQTIDRSDIQAVNRVLRSDWITQGPSIQEFEERVARYCGAKYAVAVSSGTAALHLACLAAGLRKGDEVISSPMTFLASINCAVYLGARPVFADVEPLTVNIDPQQVQKRIRKKTRAIIPVHFAGHPCELYRISRLAKRHNLIVIEDACHALGAEYRVNGKWIKVGACRHSDITVFSFHPVKAITTAEGGMITTNRKDFYDKLLMLRAHGVTKDKSRFRRFDSRRTGAWYYEMQTLGFNYRISDIQCALGLSQLKRLDQFIRMRRNVVRTYQKELKDIPGIQLPDERGDVRSAWHLYAVRIPGEKNAESKRKNVFERLRDRGIGVQVHYIPVHLQPYYREHYRTRQGEYPVAEDYYRRSISLPIYPGLKTSEIRYIAQELDQCL